MIGIAVVVFFASLSTLGIIGTEFVPAEDRGQFEVNAELPPGTSFEQSESMIGDLERRVLTIPDVQQVFSTIGVNGDPLKANLRVRATAET